MSDHLLEFLSLVATSSSEMFLIVFTIWWKHNLEKLPFGKVFYLKNLLQLQVFSWSIPVLVLWKEEAHGERELERERWNERQTSKRKQENQDPPCGRRFEPVSGWKGATQINMS